ncbi:6159_t:CDS:2, partial [Funneliformis geosporum]
LGLREGETLEEIQSISQFVLEDESLKIVELAEQVFGANHIGSKLTSEINDWHPILTNMHENIKKSYVEHKHGRR